MPADNPIGQFGIHSACFYDRDTGIPISILKIIGEANFDMKADYADLEGGSQMFSWDSELTKIGSEISLTGREYEPNTMAMLMGATLTENAAEATGAIDGYANVNGSSIKNATTGIASVDVTGADSADLKEGKYIIKATGAQAVSIYALTDVDFANGTDEVLDDNFGLVETGVSVSATAAIANFGLTLTKGSGTVALTIGDTAEFYVRKPNKKSYELPFGSSSSNYQEVGVLLAGQKQADGSITTLEIYRAKVAGFPISFKEKAWSEWSLTIKVNYDSTKNGVGTWRKTIAA